MKEFENEAKERYGKTEAYKEYAEKTAAYTEDKWKDAAEGLNAVFAKFAECKSAGHPADSKEAQSIVLALQNHITENYYTCTTEILLGLGRMYVADERFKENIDKNTDGTAAFASKAIEIYCK